MWLMSAPARFYGINLNQNVVLEEIGFDGNIGKLGSPWNRLFKIAIGNCSSPRSGSCPGTM